MPRLLRPKNEETWVLITLGILTPERGFSVARSRAAAPCGKQTQLWPNKFTTVQLIRTHLLKANKYHATDARCLEKRARCHMYLNITVWLRLSQLTRDHNIAIAWCTIPTCRLVKSYQSSSVITQGCFVRDLMPCLHRGLVTACYGCSPVAQQEHARTS